MGIFGFSRQETGAKSVAMATTQKMCHSISFVMYISGAKFEEQCFNISRDLLDSVFYCQSGTIYSMTSSLSSFALYKNVNISPEQKKIFQNRKRHSSLL